MICGGWDCGMSIELERRGDASVWPRKGDDRSLVEVFRSVPVAHAGSLWKKVLAFTGPGYLVAVGYMDPGNWATALSAGARFGYTLLAVVLISSLMAVVLQSLCARLAIASQVRFEFRIRSRSWPLRSVRASKT